MSGDLKEIGKLAEQNTKRALVESNLEIHSAPSNETTRTAESSNFKEIYQHYMGQAEAAQATSPYTPTSRINEDEQVKVVLDDFKKQIDAITEFRKEFESILQNFSDLRE